MITQSEKIIVKNALKKALAILEKDEEIIKKKVRPLSHKERLLKFSHYKQKNLC